MACLLTRGFGLACHPLVLAYVVRALGVYIFVPFWFAFFCLLRKKRNRKPPAQSPCVYIFVPCWFAFFCLLRKKRNRKPPANNFCLSKITHSANGQVDLTLAIPKRLYTKGVFLGE